MNLSTSMLIMNVVFVVGSESSLSLSGDVVCKTVAILLHYFLLSTIAWMLVEAINMYQALITVFAKYSGFFMLKRCLFAWGKLLLIAFLLDFECSVLNRAHNMEIIHFIDVNRLEP